jgi:MoxR-like ATPase
MDPLRDNVTTSTLSDIFIREGYVADEFIIIPVYLAIKMEKPLLIEGEAGCGKTEIAKVLAHGLNTELIRLQCYEGLDSSSAIYEWDYLRQLLKVRIEESRKTAEEIEHELFSERYLQKRPLLRAVSFEGKSPPVLLIDEIDRADEEFEGFLLEFLSEFQVTVPEIGSIRAKMKPIVVLTSNRTRELGDGLRRRCVYLHIGYPTKDKELHILRLKVPGLPERLGEQVARISERLRSIEIQKKPGISETVDFANSLLTLNCKTLDRSMLDKTLGLLLKNPNDLSKVRQYYMEEIEKLVQNE